MAETILPTRGAGLIGRHPARALPAAGHRVRTRDGLIEQFHPGRRRPDERDGDVGAACRAGLALPAPRCWPAGPEGLANRLRSAGVRQPAMSAA